MAKKSNKKTSNPLKAEEVLYAALKKFGFSFPTTEQEVEEFEKNFGKTNFPLPKELEDFQFIAEAMAKKNLVMPAPVFIKPGDKTGKRQKKKDGGPAKVSPSNVDYYRRIVLAAEFVQELHMEPTFGHVKLQKLIFLAQKTEKMTIPVNFLRQAMGPYDPGMMRSIDKQLLIKHWFIYHSDKTPKYYPLEKAGEHHRDFERYYADKKDKIGWLINVFRKEKTDRVEIVATLFAVWEKLQLESLVITERSLTLAFYEWSTEKVRFKEKDVVKEIKWMGQNNLVPKLLLVALIFVFRTCVENFINHGSPHLIKFSEMWQLSV
ncbi:hypothetical protein [Puia sp.]|jgi:uncharacterized protein YwgA|uniref:hypothetical protein n=1 Tax=Puia sp. TaxID=2045100 RepID=UPI002F42CEC4